MARFRWLCLLLLLCLVSPSWAVGPISGGAGIAPDIDCDDVAGNHTNWDLTTRTWTCGVSSSGGTPGNAAADSTTKGIAAFGPEFADNGSGLITLGTTLASKTLGNTNTITLKDTLFTLQDDGDTSRQLRLQLSGITAGQTRTLTVPDLTDVLVTRTSTDTLTNKTLTTPTITGPSGLVKADVGLGNVDNTSNATERAAAATLTNKTLNITNTVTLLDTLFTVQDNTDTTKQARFELSGLTTSTLRTYALPDASDSLVCLACAQTPTNKTLSGVTNTFSAIPSTAITFTDVTTGNASLSAHGLLQKFPGGATSFLNADGNFTVPAGSAPTVQCAEDGTHALNYSTSLGWVCGLINTGTPGGGDFSSNTATSVDSELVLFSGTGGKTGKRGTGTGIAKLTSGVLSVVTAPTGALVGTTDTQSLTNKTFDNTTTFETKDTLFTLQDDGGATRKAQFQLSGITAGQTRTFTLPDFNGTLSTLVGTESLSNKTLVSPIIATSLTVPLMLGGSAASSTLTLQSTSGVGTTDSILSRVGNNGAVIATTLDTLGNLGIGVTPNTRLHVLGASLDVRSTGAATNETVTHSLYDNNTTLEGRFAYLGAAGASNRAVGLFNDGGDFLMLSSTNASGIRFATTNTTRMVLGATATLDFGVAGGTNPAWSVDATAASAVTGVKLTAGAAGTPASIAATSSQTNEGLDVNAKGSGALMLQRSSTGDVSIGGDSVRTFGLLRHATSNTAGNALTLSAGGATSGATDKNGGLLIFKPGTTTGTGISSTSVQCSKPATGTGTSDNGFLDCVVFGVAKRVADAVSTPMVSMTLANNSSVAVKIDYGIETKSAGNVQQIEAGSVYCKAVNVAGTITKNDCVKVGSAQSLSDDPASTLSVVWAMSAANPAVVSVTVDSSLTNSTGFPLVSMTQVANLSSQALTLP